jgi:hypothetical protein
MIELGPDGFESAAHVRVIHHPAQFEIAIPLDGDFNLKTVAVQAAAFVGFGQSRQKVGGFKLK